MKNPLTHQSFDRSIVHSKPLSFRIQIFRRGNFKIKRILTLQRSVQILNRKWCD